jgi:hypothetical protein
MLDVRVKRAISHDEHLLPIPPRYDASAACQVQLARLLIIGKLEGNKHRETRPRSAELLMECALTQTEIEKIFCRLLFFDSGF